MSQEWQQDRADVDAIPKVESALHIFEILPYIVCKEEIFHMWGTQRSGPEGLEPSIAPSESVSVLQG